MFRSLLLILILMPLAACTATTPKAPLKASVTLDASKTGHPVRTALFGSNLQWEHGGDGLVPRAGQALPKPVMQAVGATGITSLRFPGGALANTYRWKTAIGDPGKRGTGKGFAGQDLPAHFGTDELIRMARQHDIQPVITVNLSAGPEEAADWVDYLNGPSNGKWGALRAGNAGAAPPRAVYWEIGNEIYSPNEHGHLSATAYAKRVREFAAVMKKRDPGIKIGVALEASFLQAEWMRNVYPHLLTWNEEVLREVGREVDFLSLHFYAPYDKQFGNENLQRLVWSGPTVFEGNLASIMALASKYGRPDMEVAVTEYSTFFGEKLKLDARISGTENAVFNSLMMLAFMRNPSVTLANHWSLLNNSHFGMLAWDGTKVTTRPWHDAFVRLRRFEGAHIMRSEIRAPTYTVNAKGNIPRLAEQPVIDALGARKDRNWHVVLVNRSPDAEVEVTLTGKAEELPSGFKLTLLAPDAPQRNWQPPTTRSLSRDTGKASFTIRIPKGGIAFLES